MVVLRYAYVVAFVIWIGGLVATGAFVAPSIFGTLEAEGGAAGRVLAGAAFGDVLRRVLVAGDVAGVVMLVAMTTLRLLGPRPISYGFRAGLIGSMLLTNAYTAHIVLPEAEGLRREIDAPIAAIALDDPRRVRFEALHGLATTLVTAVMAAGLVIVAWEARE